MLDLQKSRPLTRHPSETTEIKDAKSTYVLYELIMGFEGVEMSVVHTHTHTRTSHTHTHERRLEIRVPHLRVMNDMHKKTVKHRAQIISPELYKIGAWFSRFLDRAKRLMIARSMVT